MNEKGLQILEQYDIRLQRSFGGRGSLILETDQGLKLLKEFAGSVQKLPYVQTLLEHLEQRGVCRADRIVPNREGALVSVGDYDTPYIPVHPVDHGRIDLHFAFLRFLFFI